LFTRFENNFISVKRVKEYIQFESEYEESESETQLKSIDSQWPTDGQIEFHNYKASYKTDSEYLALSGINLTINAGEKIGIVGRTGAGISSSISQSFN